MKFFKYTDQKTEDAVLSMVHHNIDSERVRSYDTGSVKVCSVDYADATELNDWLSAQIIPLTEITKDEFVAARSQSKAWQLQWQFIKSIRQKELDSAAVAVNSIEYDADESAMDRVDRILTLAGWKFNKALAAGATAAEAYDGAYKITVPWKGTDNEFHDVQIESLAQAQEEAIHNMRSVWEKYE